MSRSWLITWTGCQLPARRQTTRCCVLFEPEMVCNHTTSGTCDKTTNRWTSCYVGYYTIVNGCGSRWHTFSILHYCIVYSHNGNIITVCGSTALSYTYIYTAAHSRLYKKDIIIISPNGCKEHTSAVAMECQYVHAGTHSVYIDTTQEVVCWSGLLDHPVVHHDQWKKRWAAVTMIDSRLFN